jgi:hypothetical protein
MMLLGMLTAYDTMLEMQSRILPSIPGSPEISTSPTFAWAQRRISSSIFSWRPTSGVVAVRKASKGFSTELVRSAAQARSVRRALLHWSHCILYCDQSAH